jgi:cell division protein FtsQ
MNALALLLCLAFALMVLVLLGAWLVRQSLFGLSGIVVQGDVLHNNAVTLRANVAPHMAGNFFTVDLARTKAIFESVPWVRTAVVRRQFPNRLKVMLQEHQAVAYWGDEDDTRLVNVFGEVFEANPADVEPEDLPLLNGPQGQAGLVLQAYQALAPMFEKIDAVVEGVELTGQGRWRAQLDGGAVLELGHGSIDEIKARVQRFTATLAQVSSRYGNELESADLRYSNGYAIKLKGVTTFSNGAKEDKKAKR